MGVFVVLFWLLYSLASYWHESSKIQAEIATIKKTNEDKLAEIEEKKQYLAYLKTPQRIDKEAKMQMGKKQVGENVIVFIQPPEKIIPQAKEITLRTEIKKPEVPIIEKWKWIFLRNWFFVEKK